MNNYILKFYIDLVTYPCPNPVDGLASYVYEKDARLFIENNAKGRRLQIHYIYYWRKKYMYLHIVIKSHINMRWK